MKERPILFSGPMVRAIIGGEKTQTRRVIKNVPSWDHYGRDIMDWSLSGIHQGDFDEYIGTDRWFIDVQTDVDDFRRTEIKCPYGQPGDRLWVRETWARYNIDQGSHDVAYRATAPADWPDDGRWRPSIHMPRAVSRITLEITGVRVEQLLDITDADAIAEGIAPVESPHEGTSLWIDYAPGHYGTVSPRSSFYSLWERINGRESLEANSWVWVLEFKRLEQQRAAA